MTVGEHVSLGQGPLLPGSEMMPMQQEVFGLGQFEMPTTGDVTKIAAIATMAGASAWLLGGGLNSPKTAKVGMIAAGAGLGITAVMSVIGMFR